jgi:hypothetical protein
MEQGLQMVGTPDFGQRGRVPKQTTYSESVRGVLEALLGREATLTLLYYTGEPSSSSFTQRLECLLGSGAEVIIDRINQP